MSFELVFGFVMEEVDIPCIVLARFIRRSNESACFVYSANPADDTTIPAIRNIAIVLSFSSAGCVVVLSVDFTSCPIFGDAMIECGFQDGYALSALLVSLPLPRYVVMVGTCVSSVARKMDSFFLLFHGDLLCVTIPMTRFEF